jgi:hypothetical protein
VWKSNIPLDTDDLSVSQADLNGNFTALNNVVTLVAGQEGIKFTRVAAPTTAATDVSLYGAASVEFPLQTALFFKNQNNAASVDFTSAGKAVPGWCRLPSGIELRWGGFTLNTTVAAAPCAYAKIFPNNTLHVAITLRSAPTAHLDARDYQLAVANADVTQNGFTVRRNPNYVTATVDFSYIAIGY